MSSHQKKHKEPQFLELISKKVIHDAKLLIPEDFAREYLNSVSIVDNLILTVNGGRTWEIELLKSNGIWLQNGWEKFVQDMSLKEGQIVVFRYEGGCRFHVSIFDGSCEIQYPPSSCRKKARKTSSADEPEKNPTSKPKSSDVKRGRKIKKENGENYNPSSAIKSENPYFSAEITPNDSKELIIPAWFAREHLSRTGNVKLEMSNGKTWTVVLLFPQRPNEPLVAKFMGITWKKFVKGNNLQEGDIYRFELVKSHLFRVVLESTSGKKIPSQTLSSLDTNQACEDLSFTKKIPPSGLICRMRLPAEFIKKHPTKLREDTNMILVVEGKSWDVKLAIRVEPRSGFCGIGWLKFAEDNNLKGGDDECVFNLIEASDVVVVVMKVTINRC